MSAVALRPVLWEVADVVEQIFRIAATCDLNPRPEEYDAAACDYVAERGFSDSAMREAMRQYDPDRDPSARPGDRADAPLRGTLASLRS